jgi:hypothetical protein
MLLKNRSSVDNEDNHCVKVLHFKKIKKLHLKLNKLGEMIHTCGYEMPTDMCYFAYLNR